MNSTHIALHSLLLSTILILAACTQIQSPTQAGLTPAMAPSLLKQPTTAPNAVESILWVFIEGDGTPWKLGRWPAKQPIVQTPVAYNLWKNTSAPALYLQRPCYFEKKQTLPISCTPNWWTTDIYSQPIVTLLKNELTKQLDQHHYDNYILVGHSGGGTLAMLLAAQTHQTPKLIITLAGNLNPSNFNQLHHLPKSTQNSPLVSTTQWHYSGDQDSLIPFDFIKPTCQKQAHSHCYVLSRTTHSQGWQEHWPAISQRAEHFIRIKKNNI